MLEILNEVYCDGLLGRGNGIPFVVGDLIHYVYLGIKIVVPILLVIFAMLDLGKAIAAKKEEDIKKHQGNCVKRIITGVLVFLISIGVEFVLGFVEPNTGKDSPVKCAMEIIRGKGHSNGKNVTNH